MKYAINVTQDCMDYGNHYGHSCPVALACGQAGITGIEVGVFGVYYGEPQYFPKRLCTFPQEVKQWIRHFDRGISVKPMSFELEIPEWFIQST